MSVIHSEKLETVIEVLGWLYVAVWSISYYPQIYLNWSRKSVVGRVINNKWGRRGGGGGGNRGRKSYLMISVVLLEFSPAPNILVFPLSHQKQTKQSTNLLLPGLSFDFLVYNLFGYICYSAFNFSMLWVIPVRNQYYDAFPHGVINVQFSDFCFSFHALLITGECQSSFILFIHTISCTFNDFYSSKKNDSRNLKF